MGALGGRVAATRPSSDVATSCSHHPDSRLAPASLHRVALEASASIADGRMRHAPVSSPRPERPAARAHLNPMFRTESPKTEVQTAIAMSAAAEEEKERARRRRRASARGGRRGARRQLAGRRARLGGTSRDVRAEIPARHRPVGPTRVSTIYPTIFLFPIRLRRLLLGRRRPAGPATPGRRRSTSRRRRRAAPQAAVGATTAAAITNTVTTRGTRRRSGVRGRRSRRSADVPTTTTTTRPRSTTSRSTTNPATTSRSTTSRSTTSRSTINPATAVNHPATTIHPAANPSIIATGTSPPTPLARAIAST